MITVRKAGERGVSNLGWLLSRHSFSFAEYHDPRHSAFRTLRVINDDNVSGGHGFGRHPHRDMEIISYVVSGALKHGDSMNNGSVIKAGDVQLMSAGTGVTHSEANNDPKVPVHFLQIWITPDRHNLEPSYQQKFFSVSDKANRLCLLVSREGRNGSLTIHQDASLFAALLDADASVTHKIAPGRHAWIQIVSGEVEANGTKLGPGDGAAVNSEKELKLRGISPAEVLLFDLA